MFSRHRLHILVTKLFWVGREVLRVFQNNCIKFDADDLYWVPTL